MEAVRAAKAFITVAIEHSLDIGKGHGPVNPMFD
jgi:hydroxymethylpyrimidine/phosphomethylpyrimidine kinase